MSTEVMDQLLLINDFHKYLYVLLPTIFCILLF